MAISKSEPQVQAAPAPPMPRRLGKYEVIDRLAVGGMAEIYVCCERGLAGLERLVVVKRILPHLAVHQSFVEMFLAEARWVALLSHPNVVQIFELAQDSEGAPFIAMEYVPGSSLRDVLVAAIDREQPTPVGAAISIVAQACAGAHAAHEQADPSGRPLGLVHRDISPHNLMVTSDGHTKLLDFGIAKATEGPEGDEHTRTGALKGKVHYMSPEQCKQLPLDRRSDVFALGVVLWESLAQERLFKRGSDLDSMHAIVTGDLKDLRRARPDIPEGVVRAVEKALRPDRDDRYGTADAMRKALLEACARARISCGVDDAAAFVRPLIGDAQKRRSTELLAQAQDRTQATPARDAHGEDATLVDKKNPRARAPGAVLEPAGPAVPAGDGARRRTETKLPSPRPGRTRLVRVLAASALLLTLVTGALVARLLVEPARRGPPLTLGFPPTSDRDLMVDDVEPLRVSLAQALGVPIKLVVASSYDDLQARLLRNEIDVAALPPLLYVDTKQRDPRVELVATKLVEGSAGNDSVLYVNEASGVQSIEGLRGKRVCFPDTKSTTGYLFPRLALRRAGVDPDKDVVMHNSGSHLQAMRDVVEGVCEAAATYSSGYLAADRAGVPVARARQLAIIGRSPHDAMTVRAGMAPAERARIQAALLAFKPINGGTTGRVERISGFGPGANSDYDAVREALDASRP